MGHGLKTFRSIALKMRSCIDQWDSPRLKYALSLQCCHTVGDHILSQIQGCQLAPLPIIKYGMFQGWSEHDVWSIFDMLTQGAFWYGDVLSWVCSCIINIINTVTASVELMQCTIWCYMYQEKHIMLWSSHEISLIARWGAQASGECTARAKH